MTRKGVSLIFLGYLAVYLLPLGVRPMVIPDETRYAQMGREMVQSGDWIVPRLDGLRYFQKPIFGIWMHALSIRLCGSNAFAARLPSALAVGLSAWLLGLWVRRFQGSALTALLCVAAFLTCGEVFVVGVTCLIDSLLALFVTASMISFYRDVILSRPSKKKSLRP